MGLQWPEWGSPSQVPSSGFPKGSAVRLLSGGTTGGEVAQEGLGWKGPEACRGRPSGLRTPGRTNTPW